MALNLVIPNKDNKVVLEFGGVDLTLATDIQVNFGAESYSTTTTPSEVVVNSATELELDLSSTAEVGRIFVTVTYFDGGSTNGTEITSQELGNLDKIIVAIGTQLIIEDGSIVPGANSYATDEQLKEYASLRGFKVPSTQPEREALLILAMDYISSCEPKMSGWRTDGAQSLSYPRTGVCLHNQYVPSDEIPQTLINAQLEAAIEANENSLLVNSSTQNVQSEKVGSLSVSYFSGGSWTSVRLDRVDSLLNPLLINGGSNNRMVRV